MRIGGYEIEGVEKRFWFILGAIVFFIFLVFYFWSTRPEPEDPLVSPAFSTEQLQQESSNPNWLRPYTRDFGITPLDESSALTDNFGSNVGLPFRFRAYIPPRSTFEEARQDIFLQKYNWFFEPAVFIEPAQIIGEDDLQNAEEIVTDGQPLVLGFRGGLPPDARAYEFTGLLYWNSYQLSPPENTEEVENSPIVLISDYQELPQAELQNPTTHRYNLDFSYREAGYQFDINTLEWSAGQQLRACVDVTNLTSKNKEMWSGVNEIQADSGSGSVLGMTDNIDSGQLGIQDTLSPGESVPGYIFFGDEGDPQAANVANPSQGVELVLPRLTSDGFSSDNKLVQIQVSPRDINDLSQQTLVSNQNSSGCGPSSQIPTQ